MNKYEALRNRQSNEFNTLPMKAAFGEEQFNNMMAEWGLSSSQEDIKKIRSLGVGAYCLATDVQKFVDMGKKHMKETEEFLKTDEGLKEALMYEFSNQECGYTGNYEDAITALDFDVREFITDEHKLGIFEEAKKEYQSKYE